jgi:ArsR family transcriptional regulator
MYERLFQLQEETLKTLANQKRLEILQLLNQKELTVTDMVAMLGLPQANLSQHLTVLRNLHLVTKRKDGVKVYYRLTDKRIARVIKGLREFLKTQYAHEPEIAKMTINLSQNVYPIVRDFVCGMRFSINETGESLTKDGVTYYFCASGCKEKFIKSYPGHLKKQKV